jgi:hypothetical protein
MTRYNSPKWDNANYTESNRSWDNSIRRRNRRGIKKIARAKKFTGLETVLKNDKNN